VTDFHPIQVDFICKAGTINRPVIFVEDTLGDKWTLKANFRQDDPRIPALIRKIEAAGRINPEYWNRVSRRP
jgi:hypothetical protein